ncbi:hypothetical protein VNO78_05342 [Psophocarpus tetragonolobus]|uniref:X8 domain-containing protein n=1 Tax=Psophocarpus tetragonolobus TaxID=3891 RepID=A0AAN9T0J5_PSOTE
MPGKSVDTFIFALYDEDLKPGPASERAFGCSKLILPWHMMLAYSSLALTPIRIHQVQVVQLQHNGGACYEPNTVSSHAAFAMNLYYHKFGTNPWNRDFSKTAMLTPQIQEKGREECLRVEMGKSGPRCTKLAFAYAA